MERCTIDRLLISLNSGRDGQEILTTTQPPMTVPTSRFRGQGLVNELICDMSQGGERDSKLSYDRQLRVWTMPDYITEGYILCLQRSSSHRRFVPS